MRTKYAATGVKAYKLIATGIEATGMLFNEVAPSVPDTPKGDTAEGSIWKLLGG
ncbi:MULTISPECIES: hypothetical protein [unclassified Neptuniibacter]|uniref:hypothetical protein n=1 Tax=unclassified Neptuniibacter TaxID=2630693 RepID=UPI0025EB752A|nr:MULTISPECIES: hypothetical protein [unclassified Neptuniibacter]